MRQSTICFGQRPSVAPALAPGSAGAGGMEPQSAGGSNDSTSEQQSVAPDVVEANPPPVKKSAGVVRNGKKVFGIFGGAPARTAAKRSYEVAEAGSSSATDKQEHPLESQKPLANPTKQPKLLNSNENGKKAGKAARSDGQVVTNVDDDSDEDLQVTNVVRNQGPAKKRNPFAFKTIDLTHASPPRKQKQALVFRAPKPPLPPFPTRENAHVQPAESAMQGGARCAAHFERCARRTGKLPAVPAEGEPLLLQACAAALPFAKAQVERRMNKMFEPICLDQDGKPIFQEHISPSLPIDTSSIASDSGLMRHGAIRRAIEAVASNTDFNLRSSSELLNDRWRPLQASECLGNEEQANYLRDWLKALQISEPVSTKEGLQQKGGDPQASSNEVSPRKRQVQRKVEKRAGRKRRKVHTDDELDSLDNWIASDSETIEKEGEWRKMDAFFENFRPRPGAEHDELLGTAVRPSQESNKSELTAASDATLMPAQRVDNANTETTVPALSFRDNDILTNCIVLHGPSGCGKTAMIYACAAELGYEVFELYPGMGKRSGHALEAAVGDLARNHMVLGGGRGGGATFKSKSVQDLMKKRNSDSPEKPKAVDLFGKGAGKQQTRQSIILIEEADLLYEEDKGFWVGVVELVAKSRRPVVVTCNDLSQIPLHMLPIQYELGIAPVSAELLEPYLKAVAAAEGKELIGGILDRITCGHLFSDLMAEARTLPIDGVLNTSTEFSEGSSEIPEQEGKKARSIADLRQAMLQLHFICHSAGPHHGLARDIVKAERVLEEAHLGSSIEEAAKRQDVISFADAELQWDMDLQMEILLGESVQAAGDKISLRHGQQLVEHEAEKFRTVLPDYCKDDEMRAALLAGIGAAELGPTRAAFQAMDELRDRIDFARTLDLVLSQLRVPAAHARPPRTVAAIEYAPYVAAMQRYDDEAERVAKEAFQAALGASGGSSDAEGMPVGPAGAMNTRMTRNSLRMREVGYVRWMAALDEEGMEAARLLSMQV